MPTKARKRSPKLKPGQRAEETLRVLISHKRIRERVREMAAEIRRDFPNEPIHLVGVLKGSVLFLADLARELGRRSFVRLYLRFQLREGYGLHR